MRRKWVLGIEQKTKRTHWYCSTNCWGRKSLLYGQSQCRFHEDFTRATSAESVTWQGFREEREEHRFIPTTLGLPHFQRDETLMKPH